MAISENKKTFAIALLENPDNALAAARAVFGEDTSAALLHHTIWRDDPEVLQYQKEYLREHGADSVLPTKDVYAREVYNLATDQKTSVDDRLKAFKLYGDIRGYISKPGIVATGPVQINQQRVMVINSRGSDADWEAGLKDQQTKLIDVNIDVKPS